MEDVVYSYKKDVDEKYTIEHVYLENNRLYFYVKDSGSVNAFSINKITLKYIDLLDLDFNVIDTGNSFEGYVSCKEC